MRRAVQEWLLALSVRRAPEPAGGARLRRRVVRVELRSQQTATVSRLAAGAQPQGWRSSVYRHGSCTLEHYPLHNTSAIHTHLAHCEAHGATERSAEPPTSDLLQARTWPRLAAMYPSEEHSISRTNGQAHPPQEDEGAPALAASVARHIDGVAVALVLAPAARAFAAPAERRVDLRHSCLLTSGNQPNCTTAHELLNKPYPLKPRPFDMHLPFPPHLGLMPLHGGALHCPCLTGGRTSYVCPVVTRSSGCARVARRAQNLNAGPWCGFICHTHGHATTLLACTLHRHVVMAQAALAARKRPQLPCGRG